MKILMVCLGNICRSPLAEGIMRAKIEENNLNWTIDSCGTSNYHIGENPDPRSQENALSHGIDISKLEGRQFTKEDFSNFDQIFVMDSSNYNNVIKLADNQEQIDKVDFLLNQSNPESNQNVPDPYYGGPQGFENVYQLIDEACSKFVNSSIC